MKKEIVALACAAWLVTPAMAQRPPFEFKGYKPGDAAGALATFPEWRCSQKKDDPSVTTCSTFKETIASVPVKILSITMRDGTIQTISIIFPSDSFAKVADAIQTKYGPPDNISNRVLQNRMGAQFQDVNMRWFTGDPRDGGPYMSVHKYASDVTQSSLYITILPKADVLKQQQEQATKRNSEDL